MDTNLPAYVNAPGQNIEPPRSHENSEHSQSPVEHLQSGHSKDPLPTPPTSEEIDKIESLGVNYIENPNFK